MNATRKSVILASEITAGVMLALGLADLTVGIDAPVSQILLGIAVLWLTAFTVDRLSA